jgi:hypothetical protein
MNNLCPVTSRQPSPRSDSLNRSSQKEVEEIPDVPSEHIQGLADIFPLVTAQTGTPLRKATDALIRLTGCSEEMALVSCLAAVAGAAGKSRLIRGVDGTLFSGLIHVLVVGSGASRESLAMQWPFASLVDIVREDVAKNARVGDKWEKHIQDTRTRFHEADRRCRAERLALAKRIRETPEGVNRFVVESVALSDRGVQFRRDAPEHLALLVRQCERELDVAEKGMAELARRMAPMVVGDSLSPEQILSARCLAIDGVVSNLDAHGQTIHRILSSRGRTKAQVLEILTRSFDHSIHPKRRSVYSAPSVAEIGLIDQDLLVDLLNDTSVNQSQWIPRTLLFSNPFPGPWEGILCLNNTDCGTREYEDLLRSLYDFRLRNPAVEYSLSVSAVKVLEDFLNQTEKACQRNPGLAPRIRFWVVIAQKLALLIHLGSGEAHEKVIPAAAMAQAAGLLVRVGGQGVEMIEDLERSHLRQQGLMSSRIEVLVEKIRVKGSVSLRDIQRSFSKTTVSVLRPVLQEAVEAGLIVEQDGKYAVV